MEIHPDDHFKVYTDIHKDGSRTLTYSRWDSILTHVELKSGPALQAARYQALQKQLEFAHACYMHLRTLLPELSSERPVDPIKRTLHEQYSATALSAEALRCAGIVSYVKVFDRTGLDHRKVFKDEGSKYLELHNWLKVTMRNGVVAHHNANEFEAPRTVALFGPTPTGNHGISVAPILNFIHIIDEQEVVDVLEVIDYVMRFNEQRIKNAQTAARLDALENWAEYESQAVISTTLPAPTPVPRIKRN